MRRVMLFSSMIIIFSLIFVFTGCQKQEIKEEPSNNYLPFQINDTIEDFGNPSDIEDLSEYELDVYHIHHYHFI